MTSKINSPGDSLGTVAVSLSSAVKNAADKTGGGATSGGAPPAAVDTVSLTGDAVRMQQLDRAASVAPQIDGKKVAAAKSAIADGSYRVNSDTVASKLARMDWELGSA